MTADRAVLAHLRHELRTPLNHIIGYSEMLLETLERFQKVLRLKRLPGPFNQTRTRGRGPGWASHGPTPGRMGARSVRRATRRSPP